MYFAFAAPLTEQAQVVGLAAAAVGVRRNSTLAAAAVIVTWITPVAAVQVIADTFPAAVVFAPVQASAGSVPPLLAMFSDTVVLMPAASPRPSATRARTV